MLDRKIFAIVLTCILISVILGSVHSVTRTITPAGDTFDTYIRDDLGHYWNATGPNLLQAVWDYNGTRGGTIKLPNGFYGLSSKNLTIQGNIVLEGEDTEGRSCTANGTCINLSGSASIILKEGKLHNIRINANANWTGTYALLLPGTIGHWEKMKMLDQVYVQYLGTPQRGVGIGMICSGSNSLGGCDFGPLLVNNFNEGINISTTESGYVNGNSFYNVQIDYCHYGMNMTSNGAGASGNIFTSWGFQPGAGLNCKRAICLNKGANGNTFTGFDIWDVQYMPPIVAEVRGQDNVISAGFTGYTSTNQTTSRWNITGAGTQLNLIPHESAVYQINPTGWHDGTAIKANMGHVSWKGYAKIVFMPGTYDIDTTVTRTNTHFEFEFSRGVYFRANPTFSGSELLDLGPGDIAYGPAVFDGNNVVQYGVRVYGNNATMRDISIMNCTTSGIYISNYNSLLVENCLFSNVDIGMKLNNAKYVTIALNNFNCTTPVSGYDSNDLISGNRGFNYDSFHSNTIIWNSNGKYWPATNESNMRAAANDLNTTGGSVYIPVSSFTLYSNFTIDHNITVTGVDCFDGNHDTKKGSVLNLTGDTTIIILHGKLQNINVRCITGWTGDYAVLVSGRANNWQNKYLLDNVNVKNMLGIHTGTGIGFISIPDPGYAGECIALCTFGPIDVGWFNLGIKIYAYDPSTKSHYYNNGNIFESIGVDTCTWGINVSHGGAAQCQGNNFLSIQIEVAGSNGCGIYTDDYGNIFSAVQAWDWHGSLLTVSGARNIFTGLDLWIAKTSYINVTGSKNVFIMSPGGNATSKMIINDGGTGNNFIGGRYTDNWGNTSIANNGTINHGLIGTPTVVSVNAEQWYIYAHETAKNATCFWVSIIDLRTGQPAVGTYYITWRAKI